MCKQSKHILTIENKMVIYKIHKFTSFVASFLLPSNLSILLVTLQSAIKTQFIEITLILKVIIKLQCT